MIRVFKASRMICAGHLACMGLMRKAYKILVRKPQGKRPIGMPRQGER
jgi:hypothetical protein